MMEFNKNPSRSELRIFGLGGGVILTAAALALHVWRNLPGNWTIAIIAVAVILALLGLAAPKALKWVYLVLTAATYPIGLVVNSAILAVFYFLILTPLALIMRICGRRVLEMRPDRSLPTYWSRYKAPDSKARYFNQF
jgi:hypothetical protein